MVDFINFNKDIDFQTFLVLFCSYLLILWLVVSIWVGVDAWKRFNRRSMAIGFFLLTFLLNFPILIFYFIVRPENQFEEYGEWESQGVNVPVVNFEGKDGVEMVLELKIHPSKMATAQSDMKIDVSWESPRPEMKLMPDRKIVTEKMTADLPNSQSTELIDMQKAKVRGARKVSNVFSNWGGLVRKRISKVKEVSAGYVNKKRTKSLSQTLSEVDSGEVKGFEKVETVKESHQVSVKKNKIKSKKKKKHKRKQGRR